MLVGCGSGHARRALTLGVSAVEPTWVEPGSRLQITGTGFPPGTLCELTLRDGLSPPEQPGSEPWCSSRAAPSRSTMWIDLDEAGVAALGGQGTFSGALGVACERDASHVAISAPFDIRLDLFESSFRGSARERELVERARRFVDFAGVRSRGDALDNPWARRRGGPPR